MAVFTCWYINLFPHYTQCVVCNSFYCSLDLFISCDGRWQQYTDAVSMKTKRKKKCKLLKTHIETHRNILDNKKIFSQEIESSFLTLETAVVKTTTSQGLLSSCSGAFECIVEASFAVSTIVMDFKMFRFLMFLSRLTE